MPRPSFTTSDVVRLSGCTYRELDYWICQGLLPDVEQQAGSGRPRTLTGADLQRVQLILSLRDAGVSLAAVAGAIRAGRLRPFLADLSRTLAGVS